MRVHSYCFSEENLLLADNLFTVSFHSDNIPVWPCAKKYKESIDPNGKFLSLVRRIDLLVENKRRIVEPANAIRWLGNDGTYSGGF